MTPQEAKGLYAEVCDRGSGDWESVQRRVRIIRELEAVTGKEFRNTAEFHYIMDQYFAREAGLVLSVGQKIARRRRQAKLTQSQLAKRLGVSKVMVCHYEKDNREPSGVVLGWLNGENALSRES